MEKSVVLAIGVGDRAWARIGIKTTAPLADKLKSSCEPVFGIHWNILAVHQIQNIAAEAGFEHRHAGERVFAELRIENGELRITLHFFFCTLHFKWCYSPKIEDVVAALECVLDCRPLQQVTCRNLVMCRTRSTVVVTGLPKRMHVY